MIPTEISLSEIQIPESGEKCSEELVESIKVIGLLNPIIVEEIDEGYKLIDGLQKVMAFKVLGRETIPAYIQNKE